MFRGWSQDKPYRRCEQQTVIKREGSVTKLVRFHIDKNGALSPTPTTAHPFSDIVSKTDQTEHAVVTSLYYKFLHNDFSGDDICVQIEGLYKSDKPDNGDDDNNNNDENNDDENKIIYIPCPANMNGCISETHELLERPKLKLDKLKRYAGIENHLEHPTLQDIDMDETENDELCYEMTHPLVHLILDMKNNKKFGISPNNVKIVEHDGKEYYQVSKDLVKTLKEFADISIFSKIHYTRFEQCKFSTNIYDQPQKNDDKGLTIILQIDYLVVTIEDDLLN